MISLSNEVHCVLCKVQIESLIIMQINSSFKRISILHQQQGPTDANSFSFHQVKIRSMVHLSLPLVRFLAQYCQGLEPGQLSQYNDYITV